MKINLNDGTGLKKRVLYPDNQPHVQIEELPEGTEVTLYASLINAKRVLEMLQTADAVKQQGCSIAELHIPYLMAARFDRQMEEGDSFDLRVIAKLINMVEAKKVFLYDPHSDVASALINNARIINNYPLIESYKNWLEKDDEVVLIVPDAGAAKKVNKYMGLLPIRGVVQCTKHRDLATGALSLKVLEPELCKHEFCVIIDDLCDGGGTFLQIASQIEPFDLTLIVTHGIFSKGFSELEKAFDLIITSNTYDHTYNSIKVKTVKLY